MHLDGEPSRRETDRNNALGVWSATKSRKGLGKGLHSRKLDNEAFLQDEKHSHVESFSLGIADYITHAQAKQLFLWLSRNEHGPLVPRHIKFLSFALASAM